jgi:hypothetical protein
MMYCAFQAVEEYVMKTGRGRTTQVVFVIASVVLVQPACEQRKEPQATHSTSQDVRASSPSPEPGAAAPSLEMGGRKSVTRFFVTSKGIGRGGDLGGLAGADAHCQMLAAAEGSGDHTWRAYLSTSATPTQPAVNARDRIGKGPWYNAEGLLIASSLADLHGTAGQITKETAVTEKLDSVNGVGDSPNTHDVLTGSQPDGTAFPPGDDRTCANWTSSNAGRAQVGHHDRQRDGQGGDSWNSAHASSSCNQKDLMHDGAGLFYCFAVD